MVDFISVFFVRADFSQISHGFFLRKICERICEKSARNKTLQPIIPLSRHPFLYTANCGQKSPSP